uniref:Uncharacterized protein n=1 Tax=Arundo donax TaxID=35708 RepID=A0A0A8Y1P3_ARUDO
MDDRLNRGKILLFQNKPDQNDKITRSI